MSRTLIVNADDFGRSPGINRGILGAHAEGVVTSTSLMVRYGDSTLAAVAAATAHPDLALGLHLDLAEWACRDGEWRCLYEVVPTSEEAAVERELCAQLARFRELVGREPTHLDSHQHVHREEPVQTVLVRAGRLLGIPVRHRSRAKYCGAFYGQDGRGEPIPDSITPAALGRLIRGLRDGTTELACHPAAEIDIETDYAAERLVELESLCHPHVRGAIDGAGVRLASFAT